MRQWHGEAEQADEGSQSQCEEKFLLGIARSERSVEEDQHQQGTVDQQAKLGVVKGGDDLGPGNTKQIQGQIPWVGEAPPSQRCRDGFVPFLGPLWYGGKDDLCGTRLI